MEQIFSSLKAPVNPGWGQGSPVLVSSLKEAGQYLDFY